MTGVIIVGLVLCILFFIELYRAHNDIQISKYTIQDTKIGKAFQGYQILQLSDLHGKFFGKQNLKLVQMIRKIHPDIIVMTGDMINGRVKSDSGSVFSLLKGLSGEFPVYFVKGNHEIYLPEKQQETLEALLQEKQVHVLNNEKSVLEKEEEHINLYGMWCDLKYYVRQDDGKKHQFTLEHLEKSMKKSAISSEEFNILLAHNPNFIHAYAKWGADVTLSGHIHGGMIRLPLIGGIFSPDTILFPKYSAGHYEVDGKHLIVSRGLSRGARGFRLFNRPEMIMIELSHKE